MGMFLNKVKKHNSKLLINLKHSVFMGKSHTSVLLSQYSEVSVWDFPVKTSLLVNE